MSTFQPSTDHSLPLFKPYLVSKNLCPSCAKEIMLVAFEKIKYSLDEPDSLGFSWTMRCPAGTKILKEFAGLLCIKSRRTASSLQSWLRVRTQKATLRGDYTYTGVNSWGISQSTLIFSSNVGRSSHISHGVCVSLNVVASCEPAIYVSVNIRP